MICPVCKFEYREGFIKCENCNVVLVDDIPEAKDQKTQNELKQNDDVAILQLSSFTDIAFVKSLLESENITYSSHGESIVGKVGGGIQARIFIHKSDVERALPLLKKAGIL